MGYSLNALGEWVQSHADSSGWAAYELYCDYSYSAASRRRPALKYLLTDATLGRFDMVLHVYSGVYLSLAPRGIEPLF